VARCATAEAETVRTHPGPCSTRVILFLIKTRLSSFGAEFLEPTSRGTAHGSVSQCRALIYSLLLDGWRLGPILFSSFRSVCGSKRSLATVHGRWVIQPDAAQ
jgi:hypothetical protein